MPTGSSALASMSSNIILYIPGGLPWKFLEVAPTGFAGVACVNSPFVGSITQLSGYELPGAALNL